MGADLSAINIVRHGVFSVKSFTNNESERYIVDFGDDETMPKCACQDWALSYYPCKHFFAVFRNIFCGNGMLCHHHTLILLSGHWTA